MADIATCHQFNENLQQYWIVILIPNWINFPWKYFLIVYATQYVSDNTNTEIFSPFHFWCWSLALLDDWIETIAKILICMFCVQYFNNSSCSMFTVHISNPNPIVKGSKYLWKESHFSFVRMNSIKFCLWHFDVECILLSIHSVCSIDWCQDVTTEKFCLPICSSC